MEAIMQKTTMDAATLLKIATGDTSKLTPGEKIQLITQVCEISGLDPRLAPFEFIRFEREGKEQMYARKNAADQLVQVHGIKLKILDQKTENGIRTVTVHAETRDGRSTEDIGCVNVEGLKGNLLANSLMKAVTKAKRRTVLSVCGLSLLDESEIETVPGAAVVSGPAARIMALAETAAPPPDNTQRAAEAIVEQVEAVTAQTMPDHVKPLFERILREAPPKGPNGTHTPEQVAYAMSLMAEAATAINLPEMAKWTPGMVRTLTRHFFPESRGPHP